MRAQIKHPDTPCFANAGYVTKFTIITLFQVETSPTIDFNPCSFVAHPGNAAAAHAYQCQAVSSTPTFTEKRIDAPGGSSPSSAGNAATMFEF